MTESKEMLEIFFHGMYQKQNLSAYEHHKGFFCTNIGRTCQEDLCERCMQGDENDSLTE